MKFKKAVMDYNEDVLKPSLKWTKQYWKEYTIFCMAVTVGPVLAVNAYEAIKHKLENRKRDTEE